MIAAVIALALLSAVLLIGVLKLAISSDSRDDDLAHETLSILAFVCVLAAVISLGVCVHGLYKDSKSAVVEKESK